MAALTKDTLFSLVVLRITLWQTPRMDFFTLVVDLAKLWQTWAGLGGGGLLLGGFLALGVKWVRRQHCRTLVLLRAVGVNMLQNRPPTDNAQRLQENITWWEGEVLKILLKAGATQGEIATFETLGNVYHGTVIAEKIARLGAIIDRIEGRS